MKRLILLVVAFALLTAPAFAAVTGSAHDIGGLKQCEACHVPHNASQTDKLWAGTAGTGYTTVQNLCWTCHRTGGIGDGVSVDVMNTGLDRHAMASEGTATGAITDCSGGNACHDVHTQNPNTTGKFLNVTATGGSYCVTCHDGSAPNGASGDFSAADALLDHTATATNHLPGAVVCEDCHDVHGAVAQSSGTIIPILKADNTASYWGGLCVGCHETGATGYDGTVSADLWGYVQATNDGSETTHPTTATTEGAHAGYSIGGCNACHDPHGGLANAYYLMETNANSAYCASCHSSSGDGPDVGTSTHPTPDMSSDNTRGSGATNAMPWADDINEDGNGTADWSGATADLMVCETCHSVHGRGAGTESDHFLRNVNTNNEICTFCHAN